MLHFVIQNEAWGPVQSLLVFRRGRGANPIAHVLQALGEDLELVEYDNWQILLPEGTFLTEVRASSRLMAVAPGRFMFSSYASTCLVCYISAILPLKYC